MAFWLALLISASVKLALLDSKDLWLDETYSAFVARLPWSDMIRFTTGDVHPRLYPFLLWVWIRIAGDTTVKFRLFSVLLNLGTMITMYFLGKRILGKNYAIFAVTLFAFSPILLVYSLEVRNYTLLSFIFAPLLLVHWIIAVEDRNSRSMVLVYSFLIAALFYVHYFSIFVIIALFLHWAVICRFSALRMRQLVAAAILAALFAAPGLPLMSAQHARKQQLDQAVRISRLDPASLAYGKLPATPTTTPRKLLPALSHVMGTIAGMYPARSTAFLLLAALPFFIPAAFIAYLACIKFDPVSQLAVIMTVVQGVGLNTQHLLPASRYWLLLVPVIILAMARSLQYLASQLRNPRLVVVLGACILAVYILGFYRQATMAHERPWSTLVQIVQANYQPGDEVLFNVLYGQAAFDYFSAKVNFHPRESGFPLSIYDWWNQQDYKGWGGPVIYKPELQTEAATLAREEIKTVWLVSFETSYYDPHDELLKTLSEGKHVTEFTLPSGAAGSEPRLFRISSH